MHAGPAPERSAILVGFALFGIAAGLAGQLWIDWRAPLWLDEGFTAAIADARSLRELIGWCVDDPNAPLYYLFIWLWSHLFGLGKLVLRLPSALFALGAIALAARKGHADRDVRLCWAALLALWQPGWQYTSEARCYALLLLLCVAQTIFLIRFVDRSRRGDLWGWSVTAALAILTHYYALVPAALQGLTLATWRTGALRRDWPALIAFAPALAWLGFHLPHLARFAEPATSWYGYMDAGTALRLAATPFGLLGLPLALALVGALAVQLARAAARRAPWPYTAGETMAGASALLGIVLIVGAAFFKPMLTGRYLFPVVPGAILALALSARHLLRSSAVPQLALLAIGIGGAANAIAAGTPDFIAGRYAYSFEQPSTWLRQRGVRRLFFAWDHPSAVLYDPARLAAMGGGFLRRDGWRGDRAAVIATSPDTDLNRLLSARAARRGDGFLWAFDRDVRGSAGIRFPPVLQEDARSWQCRNFGHGNIVVLACLRR